MKPHRYRVGQTVHFDPLYRATTPEGMFKVDQLLPPTGASNQYRVTSTRDGHQRVVLESELSPTA